MLTKYKAVFFDVGGTLLRVHPSVGEVYAKHARPFGFSGSAEDLDRRFGMEWKKTGGMESLGTQSGLTAERRFWRTLVFNVFDVCGGLEDFDAYFEIIYDAFQSGENWRVYEDVAESGILDKLKGRGVVLGVISNWDSRLRTILENTGLASYFDFILASTVVGSAKPDRKIFREALGRCGAAPNEACHIGDEFVADFQGARNSGMEAILIDRHGRHNGEAARKIGSFLELV
ncbi:MAG: HAD-IA family hydrolase [Nitrospinae bacterium]|nr:HAD-IA family hydrolase [Nitrospinota bacterium]